MVVVLKSALIGRSVFDNRNGLLIRKCNLYTKRIGHKGIWVEPEFLAEIEHRAKSAEGKVWYPFLGVSERTYELGTRRPKRRYRDCHHICRSDWRYLAIRFFASAQ
jgi:hypothetical protein